VPVPRVYESGQVMVPKLLVHACPSIVHKHVPAEVHVVDTVGDEPEPAVTATVLMSGDTTPFALAEPHNIV